MDGHRLTFAKDGMVQMVDFDGSNEQQLIAVNPGLSGPYFDRDYDNVFTLAPSVAVGATRLIQQASWPAPETMSRWE